jgi:hypothetical protein
VRNLRIGLTIGLVAALLGACGGKSLGPLNPSQQELDQRHCTSNADCGSGFCSSSGRCG